MMMGAGHFLFFVTPFLAENDQKARDGEKNTHPSFLVSFLPSLVAAVSCCKARTLSLSLSLSLATLARSVLKRRKKSGA
jgi:hypothetical protein